jgi:DNA-binding transcriptional LysR family regulator
VWIAWRIVGTLAPRAQGIIGPHNISRKETPVTSVLTPADLQLLMHIAESGSLAGAARALDLAPPAVTKRLAALEARLSLRLVQRNTRHVSLTAAGTLACTQGGPLLAAWAALESSLREESTGRSAAAALAGRIRLASSSGFGRLCLAPLLQRFSKRHPQVQIEMHLLDHLPEMRPAIGPQFDAAVWLWRPRKEALVARRLASNRRVVVASKAYLARAGWPQTPADLASHDCLVVHEGEGPHGLWRLQALQDARTQSVRVRGPLACNLGEVARDWALAGAGLALRSWWDVQALVQTGRLVHVLPGWAAGDADVHFVTPPRDPLRPVPERTQALSDFLALELARAPWAQANAA